MKKLSSLVCALLLSGCAVHISTPQPAPASRQQAPSVGVAESPQSLVGAWVVDLRGSPTDAPYTQPFVVESIDTAGRTIKGQFYGSEISWSRVNNAWGKVVVTFITSDGAGEYVHTATLQNGVLVGSSTAKHRNLLVPWTATRGTR